MSNSTLYLYASFIAESPHTAAALSRIETILTAYDLPYKVADVTTDESARKLWARESKDRKLPALVKFGRVIGGREEIEKWSRLGELREQIHSVKDPDLIICGADISAAADATEDTATAERREAISTDTLSTAGEKESHSSLARKVANEVLDCDMPHAGIEAAPFAQGGNTDTVFAKAKSTSTNPSADKQYIRTGGTGTDTSEKQLEEERGTPAKSLSHDDGALAFTNPEDVPNTTERFDRRPSLAEVPEQAVESSENFHADNVGTLGLVEHHRSFSVSAAPEEENG